MSLSEGINLARFYTKADVGNLLITLMAGTSPRNLVDLGAGHGTLSQAAMRRWRGADYVTVDIDETASDTLRAQLGTPFAGTHVHHVHDVLDLELHDRVLEGRIFDAAISNPPYVRPSWRPEFEQILGRAGLSSTLASRSDVSAEILFLAQGIRMTAEGGTIGLIIPDGVITGRQYSGLRRALIQHHSISTVVQLPRQSFHGTEAQAFILVFRNKLSGNRHIALQRLSTDGTLSPKVMISDDAAEHRMDYQFHSAGLSSSSGTTLESLGALIARGSINATAARQTGVDLFHTSDFGTADGGAVDLRGAERSGSDIVYAEPGDILLARIDRNLEKKVTVVRSGCMPVSDCVYRIRLRPDIVDPVFSAMQSPTGARLLFASSRGVGARLLGKAELLAIPFPIRF